MSQVVLITGCSSGFGYETAKLLSASGFIVYPTVRKTQDLSILPNTYLLDITWPQARIAQVVERIISHVGKIDVLVNNAGFGFLGPVGSFTDSQLKKQFETNVFGPVKVINAVLPHMRQAKSGTIINVSSTAGFFSGPYYGIYCASKHSLEAISQALRAEEWVHGIKVAVVNPGSFSTKFWQNVQFAGEGIVLKKLIERIRHNITRLRGHTDPKAVAYKIKSIINKSSPPKNTLVGLDSYVLYFTRNFIPYTIVDFITRRIARKLQ